ncbi:esterase-like activity of phytase family protein [Streptomyces glaucescens]|uniref:esterase-like activity of phytase family protein n=1 Tax=Streptomyces glaucescens TaxID=1907 RepID=UPI00344BC4D4
MRLRTVLATAATCLSAAGADEITATPDGRRLLLERGFTAGVGNTRPPVPCRPVPRHGRQRDPAADRAGRRAADAQEPNAGLADCPGLGAAAGQPQPDPLLDNTEAMAVTGRSHGRPDVLLAGDDNRSAARTTRFCFRPVRLRPARRGPGLLRRDEIRFCSCWCLPEDQV